MNAITDPECEYITQLLSRRHDELLHELHHAVTHEFKLGLRKEIEVTEQLRAKLAPVH